jgi:hypothetical protein
VKKSGLLIVLVVILVGLAGFLVYRQNQLQQRLDDDQRAAAALERRAAAAAAALAEAKKPKFEHKTDVLASGVVQVVPAQPYTVRITADTATMHDIKVSGRFSASGGTDNGIETFILDEDNYINWMNNHAAQALYQSGTKTVGDIQASIAKSGVYYVVFSDRKNFLARSVFAEVKLDYEKRIN